MSVRQIEMDKELSKILADCLASIEGGASVDDCLKRHPSQAAELQPQLQTWSALGGAVLVQPSTAAFNRGRQAMQSALTPAPLGFGPLVALRQAPVWATAMAAVAAAVIVLGGAAGASAALGGPNLAGDALDAVGVTNGDGEGGISHSSASDRGLECANPNAFEGAANSEDKAQNAADAQEKESCSGSDCAAENDNADPGDVEDTEEADVEAPDDAAKGGDADNEADVQDAADDESDAGTNNGNGNGNANANGQSNAQDCTDDSEGDVSEGDSGNGINNAPDNAENGKDNANGNASEGSGNADDGSDNQNDNGNPDAGNDGVPGPEGQGRGQGQD